jgi:hypothetical protein
MIRASRAARHASKSASVRFEALCRQQTILDSENKQFWSSEADTWAMRLLGLDASRAGGQNKGTRAKRARPNHAAGSASQGEDRRGLTGFLRRVRVRESIRSSPQFTLRFRTVTLNAAPVALPYHFGGHALPVKRAVTDGLPNGFSAEVHARSLKRSFMTDLLSSARNGSHSDSDLFRVCECQEKRPQRRKFATEAVSCKSLRADGATRVLYRI